MELASKYNPADVEGKWYQYWLDNKLFSSKPDGREPYTVVIPPPNVTGVLHMGHMLNNTIQDILVRRARMEGKNACWVPGTDHASIATEAKVVNKLAGQGIKKTDLSRDEFLKHAWAWTEEHGGIILKQLRKLGASCDWDRTAFTMDEERSESVIKVFVDLYNKGLIYRGVRMVNWDPKALTALSDEEVIYKEEHSKLYYLRYKVEGDAEGRYAVVATTRPETIMGDTAMCINPNDPKNQWLKGKKVIVPLVNRIIPVIEDDYVDIEFGTGCLKVTPKNWLENIKDWCISRQLWWGHRIPAYFLPEGGYVVAETAEEALKLAQEKTGNTNLKMEDLRQDDDCLDTWFSSWLWPISLFNGINNPNNEEINYYYPTSDLVTGPDIIFFWVARMIMAGYEYKGDMPFKNVYFTGIVRDKLGRKMSKSLGNSPDPLELIDKYGADGVRMGMMLAAPAGNDILFDDALCEQGRNFNNKIWNAFRLVKGWEVADIAQPEYARLATEWFESMLAKTAAEVADLFGKYRLSEALMAVYKLFWDEFSSWYLEMIKPAYGQPIDKATYEKTLGFFDNLLKLLHPFMPFITEELWQHIYDRKEGESLMVQQLNIPTACNEIIVKEFEVVKEVIGGIRTIRLQKNIAQKETLELQVVGVNPVATFNPVITKLCNLSSIEAVENKADGSGSFMVGTTEYAIPLGNLINTEEELAKLEADLKYQEGFLQSVLKKLSNEKFVSKAPANVIDMERKKQADAESKIASLKESIAALKK